MTDGSHDILSRKEWVQVWSDKYEFSVRGMWKFTVFEAPFHFKEALS